MEKKIIDKGHYVDSPVIENAVVVFAGEKKQLCLTPSGNLSFVLNEGSDLDLCLIMLPENDTDVNISIDFTGEGAKATISGLYICKDCKLSIKAEVRHRVGNCISRQLFNGIVSNASRTSKAAFEGRIIVAPDALQIKAFQENHNLLLGNDSWAETKPQLEIYADDVECSHGATIGKLNEDEQFYMRSRGIPEAEARVLQMISFLAPVLEHVPEVNRESVQARIEGIIRGL